MAEETEDWTLEERRALTALTLHQIREDGGPGEDSVATVAFDFIAPADARTEEALRAMAMFGYDTRPTEDGITVEVPDLPLTLDSLWLHEERLITIAQARGLIPDGWGFEA